jgi:hypothetical protein
LLIDGARVKQQLSYEEQNQKCELFLFYFIYKCNNCIKEKKKLYKILEACPKNIKICYPGLNDRRQQKNKTKVKGKLKSLKNRQPKQHAASQLVFKKSRIGQLVIQIDN